MLVSTGRKSTILNEVMRCLAAVGVKGLMPADGWKASDDLADSNATEANSRDGRAPAKYPSTRRSSMGDTRSDCRCLPCRTRNDPRAESAAHSEPSTLHGRQRF